MHCERMCGHFILRYWKGKIRAIQSRWQKKELQNRSEKTWSLIGVWISIKNASQFFSITRVIFSFLALGFNFLKTTSLKKHEYFSIYLYLYVEKLCDYPKIMFREYCSNDIRKNIFNDLPFYWVLVNSHLIFFHFFPMLNAMTL